MNAPRLWILLIAVMVVGAAWMLTSTDDSEHVTETSAIEPRRTSSEAARALGTLQSASAPEPISSAPTAESEEKAKSQSPTLAVLSGIVLGPDGEPAPKARVALRDVEERRCDEAGRFCFEVTGREDPFELLGATEDLDWIGGKKVLVSAGQIVEDVILRLRLHPSSGIEGRVTNQNGAPLAGVDVVAMQFLPSRPDQALVGELQRLGYTEAAPFETQWQEPKSIRKAREELSANEDERRRAESELISVRQRLSQRNDEDTRLRLGQIEAMLPTLQAQEGSLKLRLAALQSRLDMLLFSGRRTAVTNPEGRYRILGLPLGFYRMQGRKEHYIATERGTVRLTRPGDRYTVDLLITEGARYRGHVFRSDRSPAAGASIWLTREKLHFKGEADAEGAFAITGLEGGEYTILARLNDEISEVGTRLFDVGVDYADQQIFLRPGARISGRVTLAGQPHENIRVRVTSLDERPVDENVVTSSDGRFELAGLATGHYRVLVDAVSHPVSGVRFLEEKRELELSLGEERLLDIDLRSGQTIRGRVTLNGAPPSVGTYVFTEHEGSHRTLIASLDTGTFSIDSLPLGPITLFARTQDQLYTGRLDIDLASSPEGGEVDLVLGVALELSGRVLDVAGRPVESVEIQAETIDAKVKLKARSSAGGQFHFGVLYPCEYRLVVTGHPALARTVDPRIDGDIELRLED
ncbi:MAG: carboxypeptidase-like regulatory domain-containing protein [Planctomycetota bacterium]